VRRRLLTLRPLARHTPSPLCRRLRSFLQLPPFASLQPLRDSAANATSSKFFGDQVRHVLAQLYAQHNVETLSLFAEVAAPGGWSTSAWLKGGHRARKGLLAKRHANHSLGGFGHRREHIQRPSGARGRVKRLQFNASTPTRPANHTSKHTSHRPVHLRAVA
jgi:hypothetical protein